MNTRLVLAVLAMRRRHRRREHWKRAELEAYQNGALCMMGS